MESSLSGAGRDASPRQHRGIVWTLILLASITGLIAVFAVWAKRQVLETDTWTDTSSKLLEDPEIRQAVADNITDAIFTNVDVQAELQAKLPPDLQGLAGPVTGGLRGLSENLADKALQRPRVQLLWEEANRNAQQTLIRVIEDDSGETVTLDLGTIVDDVGWQTGLDLAGKLPPDAGQITIIKPDELTAVQDGVKLLKTLAYVLPFLSLALFGIAIYLARGWRREALRTVGICFIGIGIGVLFVRGLVGNAVTSSLTSTAGAEPAVDDTWSIGTSLLEDGGGAMIFYGLIILIGAWLAGPRGLARDARRAIAPVLERRTVAYSALVAILLLLFWWSPTPGFQRLGPSIVLILLFVIGLEFLRRQAIKDFPDATWEGASERWGASARSRLGRGDG